MEREERRSGQGDGDCGVAPRPPASPGLAGRVPEHRPQGAGMASWEAGAYGHPPAGKRGWGSAHRRAQPCPRAAEEGKSPAEGPERTEAAGPPVSGRRTGPRPTRGGAGRVRTQKGTCLDAGTVPGRASPRLGARSLNPRRSAPRPAPPRGLSPRAARLRPEPSPYEVVEVGGQGRAMETPRRMQSGSRGGSSPLPPPFPTTGRQLAHWPVQTPPGAPRVSPFRPCPQRHRDAPPTGDAPPTSGPRGRPTSRRQGDARRLQRRPA